MTYPGSSRKSTKYSPSLVVHALISPGRYEMETAPFTRKMRTLKKTWVIETLMYGCVA